MIASVALERPDVLAGVLGWAHARSATFGDRRDWPSTLAAFEDVAPFLLTSSEADRGLASMRLDELAHLSKLAKGAGKVLVEIGRERGGSTLAIAAAMSAEATLWSYDPQTKLGDRDLDQALTEVLRHYGLAERVKLLAEDSHTADLPPGEYGLVLVDGDSTLEGTHSDFERFGTRLGPGGDLLFHDATPGAHRFAAIGPLLAEIERRSDFERQPPVGTFAHFKRI